MIDPVFIRNGLVYLSYPIICLLFFHWAWIVIHFLKNQITSFKQIKPSHASGTFFCLIVTLFIFLALKPHFYVLNDEANLLSVSRSMSFEKTTYNTTMGNWHYWNFHPIKKELEKRPFLFPFFVHLIHLTGGYNAFNSFILNFIIFWAFLSLIFYAIRFFFDATAAIAAVFLIAAQPVVTQAATSGGFDLFFVFFVFISYLSLSIYLKSPSSLHFNLLWINLLLLAHTRYEAGIFFLATIMSLLILKKIPPPYVRHSAAFYLTPLYLLPHVFQRFAIPWTQQLQLRTANQPSFSLSILIENSKALIQSFINFQFYFPYNSLVTILGCGGAGYLLFRILSHNNNLAPWKKQLFWISFLSLALHLVFILSFYASNAARPSVGRYFVLTAVILSLCTAVFLNRLRIFRNNSPLLILTAFAAFLLYHPVAIENRFMMTMPIMRHYPHVLNYLKQTNAQNFRLITVAPGDYTIHNIAAMNFAAANANADRLLAELQRHLYTEIYVMQVIDSKTQIPFPDSRLDKKFVLEKIFEIDIGPYFIRLSRVTNF